MSPATPAKKTVTPVLPTGVAFIVPVMAIVVLTALLNLVIRVAAVRGVLRLVRL